MGAYDDGEPPCEADIGAPTLEDPDVTGVGPYEVIAFVPGWDVGRVIDACWDTDADAPLDVVGGLGVAMVGMP